MTVHHGSSGTAEDTESRTRVTAGRATGIMAASITAAASSLLITVISARTLTVAQNKEFLVFWGFMFGIFGVISGIQTESTRAALAGRKTAAEPTEPAESAEPAGPPGPAAPARRRARILATALLLGLVIAALTLLAAPAWVPSLTPSRLL